jgi:hypothetical protein
MAWKTINGRRFRAGVGRLGRVRPFPVLGLPGHGKVGTGRVGFSRSIAGAKSDGQAVGALVQKKIRYLRQRLFCFRPDANGRIVQVSGIDAVYTETALAL